MKVSGILLLTFLLIRCSSVSYFSWNNDAQSKLEILGLTKDEAIVLASIVERETDLVSEKPKIAGLYLNRLNKDWPLQSDPTVLFAIGDTSMTRLLKRHLSIDSPYNTYMYSGLPPGPICEPSPESIEAVLSAESHNYLYFCLAPDFSGRFNYAETIKKHQANTELFIDALNSKRPHAD